MFTILVLLIITTTTANLVWGPITWTNSGRSTESYIAGGNGGVTLSGNSITLNHQFQPRVYVVDVNQANSWTQTMFQKFNLLDKSIQFTMDLSTTGCGCNAAFYLTAMPKSGTSDFYCDANDDGHYCVELDIFEANSKAFQVTAHCGDGSTPCKWGCAVNSRTNYNSQYNIGGSVIDTSHPFDVAISFISSGGSLNEIVTRLTQNGKSLSFSVCNPSQLAPLTSAIKNGMVLIMSYWSGSMNWLDGCSPTGDPCPSNSHVTFSNIRVAGSFSAVSDDVASNNDSGSGFVGSPAFFAVIALSAIVVVTLLIVLIVWRIRSSNKMEVF